MPTPLPGPNVGRLPAWDVDVAGSLYGAADLAQGSLSAKEEGKAQKREGAFSSYTAGGSKLTLWSVIYSHYPCLSPTSINSNRQVLRGKQEGFCVLSSLPRKPGSS